MAYLVTTYEVSQRRACEVVRAPRSMVRYRHRRPDDAALRARLKDLASERRRFGYRRLNQMLKREGTVVNPGKRAAEAQQEAMLSILQDPFYDSCSYRDPLFAERRVVAL